ncbi:hypothetical protein FRB95_002773 [Tulasnella sp. JGI-2019a]|nr:hypothetical protein FRB95_002773 [Tulasnella sp. JGI-2019a]
MTSALTQQWLRQIIGPYSDKDRVFADVDQVLASYTTLRPKTDVHTFDDGREQLLLCIHGLIPITFRQSTYNIPVMLWLTLNYPRDPPITYVVPTSDMLVRPSQDVEISGKCQMAYLKDWERKSEGCTIKALVESMQEIFSRSPPLYAKPKNPPLAAQSTPPRPTPVPAAPLAPAQPPPPPVIGSPQPPSLPPGYQHPLLAPSVGPDGRPILPAKPASSSLLTQPVAPTPPPALPFSTPSGTRPPPPFPGQVQSSPPTVDRPPPPPWAQAFQASPQGPHPPPQQRQPLAPPHQPPYDLHHTQSQPNHQWTTPDPPPTHIATHPTGSSQVSASPYHATPPSQVYTPGPPPPPNPPSSYMQSPPPIAPTRAAPPTNFMDADNDIGPSTSDAPIADPPFAPPRPINPELLHLHNTLHQKFSAELQSFSTALAEDGERQRATQTDLLHGEPAIRDEMARLVAVRDVCGAVAERLRGTVQAAEANVQELKRKGDPEVDELVCSTTIVYNQLVNLVAEDNAIEDTIYHLHRALNSGRIDLDRFIKTTRVLAEEQFMKRALVQKIRSGMPMGASSSWS